MSDRFEQRYQHFTAVLTRLQDALLETNAPADLIRDAVIQRFEFTYELAWKTMKDWLAQKDIDVRNAKDTLKEALAQGVIADGNRWSVLHEARNLTSHTYDEATANASMP